MSEKLKPPIILLISVCPQYDDKQWKAVLFLQLDRNRYNDNFRLQYNGDKTSNNSV